ncbi:MFS transporter [Sporomusa acidovorans]|uniref:Fosfomycin resistance protein AbaF n=1 Tax=Sporomusa acidovorans (strain ATCC 49682 / DSM 3132 / Mol) TaxID=1123286 RepID=A0ABZ3J8T4_SPOA4|nr:MFS transporter [Sporomusa acidovorans]OZC21269.1 proline/betaine transporter [Sporomusa acidovorans DSM 3132]SDE66521.1 MFS transporter, MHS family, shikimate and dehydroshikimate transport protein [Sporomusa acidovorans]
MDDQQQNANKKQMMKVVLGSYAGALMEWYDFFIYGTASALVFNKLFFPQMDAVMGTILAFATFGVGFVARPLGGIIFGHYGDKIGRKKILIMTIMIMGLGTCFIGLLPTYNQIGIWAPILLTIMRILQGIGLGGEYGGAALITIEHAPRSERGFWGSLPQSATSGGILLATGVFAIISKMPEADLLSWGWRIPFLISVVLLILGVFIRSNVSETPEFEKMKAKNKGSKIPLFELFKKYPKNIMIAFGARLGETVSSNILNAFCIAYISNNLGMSKNDALTGILIASIIGMFICPLFGYISDKIGRRPVYMAGAGFLTLFAFPFFYLVNMKDMNILWIAIILGYTFGPTLMFSVQSVFFSELVGTQVRYSGLSIAYQGSAIIGGFTPLIATTLLATGGGQPWHVAGYLCVISLLSFICTYLAAETFKKDVSEMEDEEASI